MRHELRTEIEIEAPPSQVWTVLTDLGSWSEWNPFITRSEGTAEVGQHLVNRMEPPGGRPMTFKPIVTEVSSMETFAWQGRLGVAGVFDGRHRFELHRIESGTKLVHSEQFSGILVRPMLRSLEEKTRAGFVAMNQALKERVEKAVAAA